MIYHIVAIHEQRTWIKRGWRVANKLPGPHSKWSVLMVKLPWWQRLLEWWDE